MMHGERDAMRALRRVAGHIVAAARLPSTKTLAMRMRPPLPPSQPLPHPTLFAADSTFADAARVTGLLSAVGGTVEAAAAWPPRPRLAALTTWAALLSDTDCAAAVLAGKYAPRLVEALQVQLDAVLTSPGRALSPAPSSAAADANPLADTASSASGSALLDTMSSRGGYEVASTAAAVAAAAANAAVTPPPSARSAEGAAAALPASVSTAGSPAVTPRCNEAGTALPRSPTALLEAYMSVAVTLLATPMRQATLRGRRAELVAYALACGIGYRLSQLLSLYDSAANSTGPIPQWVQHSLLLLRALTAPDSELSVALEVRVPADESQEQQNTAQVANTELSTSPPDTLLSTAEATLPALIADLSHNEKHYLRCKLAVRLCNHAALTAKCCGTVCHCIDATVPEASAAPACQGRRVGKTYIMQSLDFMLCRRCLPTC